MASIVYANRVSKKDIDFKKPNMCLFYYRNSNNKLVAIIGYHTMFLNDKIALYTASNHKFIDNLNWAFDMPHKNERASYWVCV